MHCTSKGPEVHTARDISSVKYDFQLESGHYLEQGSWWMILGRGYGFLEGAGGGVMKYPQRKKEGLLEINEHFIHSKEYGFIVLVSH